MKTSERFFLLAVLYVAPHLDHRAGIVLGVVSILAGFIAAWNEK